MLAYRLCKAKWASVAFSGEGAAEFPGRWNLPSQKAVYCAETRSLGALEILAHVSRKHTLSHMKFVAIPVEIPDNIIHRATRLPRGWSDKPHTRVSQTFGGKMLAKHAAVVFPSAITRGEFTVVLNPDHRDFAKISFGKSEPFAFDSRVIWSR